MVLILVLIPDLHAEKTVSIEQLCLVCKQRIRIKREFIHYAVKDLFIYFDDFRNCLCLRTIGIV